jgi:dTDP-4-dehydrorhamnose 3,5-epimerase-like enzyme
MNPLSIEGAWVATPDVHHDSRASFLELFRADRLEKILGYWPRTAQANCSEPYLPDREHGIDPLDPELGIEWPTNVPPVLSPKDAGAPSLAQARRAGLLPAFGACQALLSQLPG